MDETVVRLLAECLGSVRPFYYVYFLRNEASGLMKIGYGVNPWSRLASARIETGQTVCGVALLPGGQALERHLHRRFAAARRTGEWFEATPELLAYIDENAERWHSSLPLGWTPALATEMAGYERRARLLIAALERQLAIIGHYRREASSSPPEAAADASPPC